MDTRRNVSLWALYDFANSIVCVVFFLYFAQWAVIDSKVSDLHFNLTFTVSAFLLLLTAPLMGFWSDKFLRRITGLRVTTILTCVSYSLCAFAAVTNYPTPALIFFTLGLYAYLLSFTFYTPLINDIVKPTKRGVVSGIGIAANYVGQFAGLLLVLPLASGKLNFFGGSPRAETLFPAIVVFFIAALPLLLFFDEPVRKYQPMHLKQQLKNLGHEMRALMGVPSVLFFLMAFFLFNDAVLTAGNNFPIFLQQVWQISDTTKTYILLGIIVTSAIGGMTAGILADRYGHKRVLMYLLLGWIFILPILAMQRNFHAFVVVTTLLGFWYGAIWTVSRSVMAYVAPKGRHNLSFAFYSLAERASSFVGPIVWGFIVTHFMDLGSDRYRLAMGLMAVFVLLGLLCLQRVKED